MLEIFFYFLSLSSIDSCVPCPNVSVHPVGRIRYTTVRGANVRSTSVRGRDATRENKIRVRWCEGVAACVGVRALRPDRPPPLPRGLVTAVANGRASSGRRLERRPTWQLPVFLGAGEYSAEEIHFVRPSSMPLSFFPLILFPLSLSLLFQEPVRSFPIHRGASTETKGSSDRKRRTFAV